MFRIECFVDDKKLPAALHALIGLSHGAPSVTPVANAIRTKNGLAAATSGKGSDMFMAALKTEKVKEFRAAQAREIAKRAGLNAASTGYFLKNALQAGAIRKSGKGSNMIYRTV